MMNHPNVVLTNHAIVRAQQRGVGIGAVRLVAIHGHRDRAKNGNVIRTMRSKEICRLLHRKIQSAAFVERARGVQIVTNEADDEIVVVTVNGKMNR